MSINITFIAHATTFDNEAGISTGQADVELSPLGKTQATKLKGLLEDRDFDIVYCSDLLRAVETAKLAFPNLPLKIDKRLREVDIGIYTGKKDSVTEPLMMTYISHPYPDGESLKDVEKRIKEVLDEISLKYQDKNVVIIGHQATQFALEVLVKDISWKDTIDHDWRKKNLWHPGWEYVI
jgi:broad specificity phosphatase PhoE